MTTKIKMQLSDPDRSECTLTITMPLKRWKELRDQLGTGPFPSWKLRAQIREMIDRVESFFKTEWEEND